MTYDLLTPVLNSGNVDSYFSLIEFNRNVKMATNHFKILKKSIKELGYLIQPIVAVRNFDKIEIIDGQHRARAVSELIKAGELDSFELPVLVNNKASRVDVATANNTSRPWDNMEYVESYATQGDPHAQLALEMVKKYVVRGFRETAILLAFIDSKTQEVKGALKAGTYKVNQAIGEKVLDSCLVLESLSELATKSKPVEAMRKIIWEHPEFDAYILRRKIKDMNLNPADVDALFNINNFGEIKRNLLGIYFDEEL